MNKTRSVVGQLIVGTMLLGAAASMPAQRRVRINLGTVAPEGSPWHEVLQRTGQEWEQVSQGSVTLRIYPGGVLGDEHEMLRKVRIGQLHAVALSGTGLSHAEPAVSCLQIPLLIESYEELDFLRERLSPKLEAMLERKGFVVLNWGDVGWVHFFTKSPARTPDDIRKMKLFTSAGDPETEALYKEFGFRPVPLAVTDMLPALQTGLLDAIDVPPLFALLEQSFGLAKNMTPIKWAPLIGATIVSKQTWERIPQPLRSQLLRIARTDDKLRGQIRKLNDDAIVEMEKRGLNIIPVDEETKALWKSEAEAAYPKLRGRLVPAELFDETIRLHHEFQASQKTTLKQ